MPRKTYNKLIRDKIPEIIRNNNAVPKISELSAEEFKIALNEKLLEEARELAEAKSNEEILNELADILEVAEAVAKNNNITSEEIIKRKDEKKQERGAFEKKLFLEYVDEK
jgi:predicted house-cleaning noncanonical NTP pyrophosphatase (MazG superfamily)